MSDKERAVVGACSALELFDSVKQMNGSGAASEKEMCVPNAQSGGVCSRWIRRGHYGAKIIRV